MALPRPTIYANSKKNNYKGFLIGETFMKEKDPGEAFKKMANELKAVLIDES